MPREVRDEIYGFLLCAFDPEPMYDFIPEFSGYLGAPLSVASHSIDTSILQTSRGIHREAYDVMVKRNKFVLVESQGIPILYLLRMRRMPMVTVDKAHVEHFKGYVLSISLFSSTAPSLAGGKGPFSGMMLARDLGMLCECLVDGDLVMPRGFTEDLLITINVGPVVAATAAITAAAASQGEQQSAGAAYKDLASLEAYFTGKTQRELLQPFCYMLRGFPPVQLSGLVSDATIASTMADMARGKWGGRRAVLADVTAAKELGTQQYKAGNTEEACLTWENAAVEVQMLRAGCLWEGLAEKTTGAEEEGEGIGSVAFIEALVNLYFRLWLNAAHVHVGDGVRIPGTLDAIRAESCLWGAERALGAEYWKKGYIWQPPRSLEAKLHFRRARLSRLLDSRASARDAVRRIDQALWLFPDDPVIVKERQQVVAWANADH